MRVWAGGEKGEKQVVGWKTGYKIQMKESKRVKRAKQKNLYLGQEHDN